jgi:hypothetical protein
MSTSKLFGKDIFITSTTNASGTTVGSISTLGGLNVNQTVLISGALTSIANSNTIGNIFTTGGNVGINTTNPSQRLDVNGNLNFTGNLFQNGSVYSGSTQWGSTGANIYFNTGNVGIGTTSPGYTLDVRTTTSGAYTYSGNFLSPNITAGQQSGIVLGKANSGNNVCEIRHFHAGDGSNQNMLRIGSSGLDNIMSIRYDGNVGIGTTAPSFKLDVNGTIRASGPGGAGSNGSVLITGADSYGHSLYIASSTGTQQRIGFQHTGTIGSIFAYDYGTGTSQNLILQSPGGNVGIGTNSADCRLVVNRGITNSDVIPTTGLGGSTVFNFLHTGAGTTDFGLIGGVLTTSGLSWLQSKYTATSGTLPMGLQPLGGNVGIGTINPATKLHVFGQDASSNTAYFSGVDLNKRTAIAHDGTRGYLFAYDYGASTPQSLLLNTPGGNVGIGIANPAYPLHVNGSANTGSVGAYAGYYSVYSWANLTANYAASIYTSHFIVAGQGFASLSDSRIKKDIIEIDDQEALERLRQIQPKKYKYKDFYSRGTGEVYGFIAQQVEEVMPYAVGTNTDYIPNILKKSTLEDDVITMKENETHGLEQGFTGNIKIFTETEEKIVTLKQIIDTNKFSINESLPPRDYFVYGIQVDDFKFLNKEAIFTTSVAALQQLDRELQELKNKNNLLTQFIQSKFPGELI